MEQQEFPFRPRGKHGFDRDDVINYISQAQLRCNEHLARMEELESAKNAWYTQAKSLEREKAALTERNRELEEQMEQGAIASPAPANDWFGNDPLLSSSFPAAEAQELAAVKARCLELEQTLQVQQAAGQELEQALAAERSEMAALREELRTLEQALAEREAQEAEVLPRFTMHQQELEALRAQLEQQIATVQGYAARVATLEQQKSLLEGEKNSYEEQLPALQAQLARLAESAEQISTLEALKAGLVGELDAAREQGDALAAELAAQKEACAALKREKEAAAQQTADDAQALADAEEQLAEARDEIAGLRSRVKDLESNSAEANEETLRSMVLASFNYSNLYVDNNLKTAQFISDATSRNIGRVSDSANSLLEQLEVIGRSFNDTTDHIRRNLTAFQRELGTIQSGMNRRLSQDRFKALLEENERLRNRLETELLAELNSEEDETPAPLPVPPGAIGPQIPFAEDLSGTYNEFME